MSSSRIPANRLSRSVLLFVVVVSCAHALVHVLELSLSSVEQIIGEQQGLSRARMGNLGTAFRLPFGIFALLTGLVADRFGPKRLLIVYLLGSAAVCGVMPFMTGAAAIFSAMFLLGCFAAIYHPAGLALLSHATTPHNRGRALGLHGIFGSVGIAGAPFVAGLFLSTQGTWQQYYLLLTVPLIAIAVVLFFTRTIDHCGDQTKTDEKAAQHAGNSSGTKGNPEPSRRRNTGPANLGFGQEPARMNWPFYVTAVASAGVSGMVYAGFLHFLPRYLNDANLLTGWPEESSRNYLAALALICGAVGQWIAGRLAKPGRLEWLFFLILLGNAPFLFWMAYATGSQRLLACCLLALVHFMNQPVYNSLLATLIPPARRSTGYGFSNMINFGVGALGPTLAGLMSTDRATYTLLASIALAAALLAIPLVVLARKSQNGAATTTSS